MSSFQALATAIAAQVGTGNIAGAATALAIGGAGAIFWMWIAAFLGMATIYAEAIMAQKYKTVGADGQVTGGPVYYIRAAFKGTFGKVLAGIFAVLITLALGFMGNAVQSNSIAAAFHTAFGIPQWIMGLAVAVIALFVFAGGIERIAKVTETVVPFMAALYIVGALIIIIYNYKNIPYAFASIFVGAFAPQSVVGGAAGATVKLALTKGVARGLFSNEAGMGTAATVHATAQTDNPAHQGMYGILEVFIDTIIICTLTSLAIICSGVWSCGDTGVVLTFDAFRSTWGFVGLVILCIAVVLFTYSSYLGFFVEFRTCVEYLFGEKAIKFMKWLFLALPIVSVTLEVEQVWISPIWPLALLSFRT